MILSLDKTSQQKLSSHFKADEFHCRCIIPWCDETLIDEALVAALEELRALVKRPIQIESGYRCRIHNLKVGGAPNSYHLHGKAVDVRIPNLTGVSILEIADMVPAFKNGGGEPHNYTCHLDVRGYRWRGDGDPPLHAA